ncbi:MAG: zinc-ribbon domain-containing protein [Planctomycetota bacterium]
MILIGTMNLTRTLDSGQFFCPTCAVNEGYQLRAVRPWLTLYFIPVCPVGGIEQHVRCASCKSIWDPSVLSMDEDDHKEADRLRYVADVMRAAVLMVVGKGSIDDEEIQTLMDIGRERLKEPITRDELGWLCSQASASGMKVENLVLTACPGWNDAQRAEALRILFIAASSGGQIEPEQLESLGKLRQTLNLTEDEYRDIIQSVAEFAA